MVYNIVAFVYIIVLVHTVVFDDIIINERSLKVIVLVNQYV